MGRRNTNEINASQMLHGNSSWVGRRKIVGSYDSFRRNVSCITPCDFSKNVKTEITNKKRKPDVPSEHFMGRRKVGVRLVRSVGTSRAVPDTIFSRKYKKRDQQIAPLKRDAF